VVEDTPIHSAGQRIVFSDMSHSTKSGNLRPCIQNVSFCYPILTRNSSADEIANRANVNFLYDDIVGLHVLQNAIDSRIPPQIDAAVMCGTHVYQIQ